MAQSLTVGQLAHATGVPAKTIRYYEQVGVLSAPSRTAAGYRQYTQHNVHRLLFIRRARALGLSLQHLKALTAELDHGPCAAMRPYWLALVQVQLHTMRERIADFQLLQQQLEQVYQRLLTVPSSAHAKGCRCLELDAVSPAQNTPQSLRTPETGGTTMQTQSTMIPLTLLATTTCDDGSCGCGCGLSLMPVEAKAAESLTLLATTPNGSCGCGCDGSCGCGGELPR